MLQPGRHRRGLLTLTCLGGVASAVACGGGRAPELTGLRDQVAQVGSELTMAIDATDPDGDRLSYGFRAADLGDLTGHASITQAPSGSGVFRWTPLGADVGSHAFDFTASDGGHTTTVTITIEVRSAIGAATAPVFRQPLGTGTTIDLARQACVDLDVVIEDQDTTMVKLAQAEPVIAGAALTARDGRTATWHWCPTREQQAEARQTLVLTADDGDNPRTTKNYLVVLRGGSGATCPGAPPVIAHTPRDTSSVLDLAIDATISDDKGIKAAPLVYYASTPPTAPPDLSRMTQVTAVARSGDRKAGVYEAMIPNPVALLPAGARQTLYYVVVADDDDDPTGSCDHTTVSPVYMMAVTSTAAGNLPACAACTSDVQCGAGNECVRMGGAGASYCVQACTPGCAAGYACSANPVPSVDGRLAPACVPVSGSCQQPAGACADDSWEVNDSRADAARGPALAPDLYDLVSCPSPTSSVFANDDWYKLTVATDQRVDLQLAGGPETDLDLHVYRADGALVTASTSLDPDEQILACLTPATYYVKVDGYGHARNAYLLSYDSHAEACATSCVDDAREDDDTYSQARPTTAPSFGSTGNAICPNDDDWYKVVLRTGQVLTVDLTFTQSTSSQDLDLHLYRDSLDLTPCDAANPSTCTVAHGQGGVSNEHTSFTAPAGCAAGCDYYVVVRGYNRSANQYGIAIGVQ